MRIIYTLDGQAVDVNNHEVDGAYRVTIDGEPIPGSWMNTTDAMAAAYWHGITNEEDQ